MIGLETSSYTTLFVKIKGRRQIYEPLGCLSLSVSLSIALMLHVLEGLCTSRYLLFTASIHIVAECTVQVRGSWWSGGGGQGGQEVRELFCKQSFLLNERSVVLCLGTCILCVLSLIHI